MLTVTPWLAPQGGGLERYASSVARELAARGHDVTLVGHADEAVDERDPSGGVRRIGVPPTVRLSNTPLALGLARRLRRLLRDEPRDVVHAHTPVPGAAEMAAYAARKEGVPFVVTYHAGRLLSGSRLLAPAALAHRATLERRMLARAAGRIAVSPYVAEGAFRGLASTLAPPGVDLERFAPDAAVAPVPGRVLFVGSPARAYRWKGLDVLARAVRRVPGARLRVVGDGDLAERYRAQGVDVVGRVDDARLADEYRAASVVCLPSLTDAESFGMVLAEANACGRPVVGSRVGGIPSFVRDGENGYLAEPGNEVDLARALGRILRDAPHADELGRNGRALVERDHAWARVADATLGVLAHAATAASLTRRTRRPAWAGTPGRQ